MITVLSTSFSLNILKRIQSFQLLIPLSWTSSAVCPEWIPSVACSAYFLQSYILYLSCATSNMGIIQFLMWPNILQDKIPIGCIQPVLPTLPISMVSIRCQYQSGRGRSSTLNRYLVIITRYHQHGVQVPWSDVQGKGTYHRTYPMMHMILPSPPWTDRHL